MDLEIDLEIGGTGDADHRFFHLDLDLPAKPACEFTSWADDAHKLRGTNGERMTPDDQTTEAAAPRRRRLRLRVLALLFGLFMGLLVAEVGVRVAGMEPPRMLAKRHLMNVESGLYYDCYPSNPGGDFSAVPDVTRGKWKLSATTLDRTELPLDRLQETPFCVEYRVSRRKMRDRDYGPTPPAGIRRIVCAGDSFVFGEGVPVHLTLPRKLESLLGPGHEVVNGGVPGWNMENASNEVPNFVSFMGCDRAVVVFVPNDIELTQELADRQDYINDLINVRGETLAEKRPAPWYSGYSRLVDLIEIRLRMGDVTRSTIRWYQDSYEPEHNAGNLDRMKAHFRKLATIDGCRVALVLYPLLEGQGGDYPLASVHTRVAELAKEEVGLPALDLVPALSAQSSADLWVHPVDRHPNARAHAIAAQAIHKWLGTIPGFLE